MVRLLAERYDTKSNVKLGGFLPKLQVSYLIFNPVNPELRTIQAGQFKYSNIEC